MYEPINNIDCFSLYERIPQEVETDVQNDINVINWDTQFYKKEQVEENANV